MKHIAHEMNEVAIELGLGLITSSDILEVYKLEQSILAHDSGLGSDIILLDRYLSFIESVLGEERMEVITRDSLIDIIMVLHSRNAH